MNARRIIGIICLVMCLIGIIVSLSGNTSSIATAVLFGVIGLPMTIIRVKSKEELEAIRQEKEKLMAEQQEIEEYNNSHVLASHLAGLPFADGTDCIIGFEPDVFIFEGSGTTIRLACDKITDISVKTDTDIQKQYVSDVGEAIWNYETFGKLGAILLNNTEEITNTTITNYLIFTYLKDGEIDYVGFVILENLDLANSWVEMFEQNYGSTNEVTMDL
ncbi:MAG: hypothetical protein Q8865_09630 [Bacillota bacterium]|nr:hypothetical protein [Bacillota bacterium]